MVELSNGTLEMNCKHVEGEFREKLECSAEEGEFIEIHHNDKNYQWSRKVWCKNGIEELADNMEENMRTDRDAVSTGSFVDAVDDSECHFVEAETKVKAKRTGWQTRNGFIDLTPRKRDYE